jgi:hypothetical protein
MQMGEMGAFLGADVNEGAPIFVFFIAYDHGP